MFIGVKIVGAKSKVNLVISNSIALDTVPGSDWVILMISKLRWFEEGETALTLLLGLFSVKLLKPECHLSLLKTV